MLWLDVVGLGFTVHVVAIHGVADPVVTVIFDVIHGAADLGVLGVTVLVDVIHGVAVLILLFLVLLFLLMLFMVLQC